MKPMSLMERSTVKNAVSEVDEVIAFINTETITATNKLMRLLQL